MIYLHPDIAYNVDLSPLSWPQDKPDYTEIAIIRADFRPIELLVLRTRWSVGILIQARNVEYVLLPWIGVGILLVTPAAEIFEPVGRCAPIISGENSVACIVGEPVRARNRVPEGAFVGIILDGAVRQIDVRNSVVMRSADRVVRVCSIGHVHYRLRHC